MSKRKPEKNNGGNKQPTGGIPELLSESTNDPRMLSEQFFNSVIRTYFMFGLELTIKTHTARNSDQFLVVEFVDAVDEHVLSGVISPKTWFPLREILPHPSTVHFSGKNATIARLLAEYLHSEQIFTDAAKSFWERKNAEEERRRKERDAQVARDHAIKLQNAERAIRLKKMLRDAKTDPSFILTDRGLWVFVNNGRHLLVSTQEGHIELVYVDDGFCQELTPGHEGKWLQIFAVVCADMPQDLVKFLEENPELAQLRNVLRRLLAEHNIIELEYFEIPEQSTGQVTVAPDGMHG